MSGHKTDYLDDTKFWGPSPNAIIAVQLFNKYEKRALDLGCGSLRNSKYLFNCGFIVDAIDKDRRVKKYAGFFKNSPKKLFNLKIADYLASDFGVEKYDIIVSENSLSFNEKEKVKRLFKKIKKALKKWRVFCGKLIWSEGFPFREKRNEFLYYKRGRKYVKRNR